MAGPLIEAEPSAVIAESRVTDSSCWLLVHEKSSSTVASPPDREALVSVRSSNSDPAGMPLTEGCELPGTGPMSTLSPLAGTPALQFFGSPQVLPSPLPVQVSVSATAGRGG